MNQEGGKSNLDPHEYIRHMAGLQHASDLAEFNADLQRSLESFNAGNLAGREALKAITFINGGAAVAMLAFLGHLASIDAGHETIATFGQPLSWFVQGVFYATVATGNIYFSRMCAKYELDREFEGKNAIRDDKPELAKQKSDAAKLWRRMWAILNLVTILFGICALVCFGVGCYVGFRALEVLQLHRGFAENFPGVLFS